VGGTGVRVDVGVMVLVGGRVRRALVGLMVGVEVGSPAGVLDGGPVASSVARGGLPEVLAG